MTENEQLKKNTDESKARQTVEAVSGYLDRLTRLIGRAESHQRDSNKIFFVAWAAWFIVGFFVGTEVEYWFLIIFIMAVYYDYYRFAEVIRLRSEFRGAIEMLRLLGYINLPERGDKTKRPIFEEGVSLVKQWFASKKEAQEKVYSPV